MLLPFGSYDDTKAMAMSVSINCHMKEHVETCLDYTYFDWSCDMHLR